MATQKRTFPAVLKSLGPIRDFVRALAASGLDERSLYRLVLAVDELATNVIAHGYNERQIDGSVDVWVRVDEEAIVVTLEDDAPPFDASLAPLPGEDVLEAPLEDRRAGGLGLLLIRDGVDVFHYERADGRNRNTLVKRTTPS